MPITHMRVLRASLLAAAAAATFAVSAPAMAQGTPKPAATPAAAAKPVAPPVGAYGIDKTHAAVTWKIMHQGLTWYVARFTSFEADLNFNAADVSKSSLNVSIDPASVETDFGKTRPAGNTTDFNGELATDARFFNAGKFPKITFVSTKVTKTGAKAGKVTGNLTFLGVTKPVTLDVTFDGDRFDQRANKHKLGFSATGTVKRSEFGMNWGLPMMGDDVKLDIHAEFVQK
jgi:polyisoprenoid-binding protein YceI